MRLRAAIAGCGVALVAAGCSSPTAPPKPPVVNPSSAPLIQSISVPTSRVETGQNIAISAVVVDAETPLTQLVYAWTATAGTITGTGATATWTHPAGITSGIDVTVTLTVTDTYDAVENNQIVKKQYVVSRTSSAFRVHDSNAEQKALAHRFLVELFGNSAVPVEQCLVDFSEVGRCAKGKALEREDVQAHRRDYVVISASISSQTVESFGPNEGRVVSISRFVDIRKADNFRGDFCGAFVLTTIYDSGRWWLCESTLDRSQTPTCANNSGVNAIWEGRRGGRSGGTPIK